jgi:TM2 domain
MADKQEEILDKIRERVLERERELQLEQDKDANLEATLQALEDITEVPREEMERITAEIKASYENPRSEEVNTALLPVPVPVQGTLPATVREAVSKLPQVLKEEFYEEYALAERKKGLSYLFWLIPPPLSCHYFYNNRFLTQILYTLTCGGLLIWWIVDFFRIPQLVQDENRKTARKNLKKMMKQSLRRQRNERKGHRQGRH